MSKSPLNPTGVRTVTVIVTHDDQKRDFSRTYTTRQIRRNGAGYVDTVEPGSGDPDSREWWLETHENMPEAMADRAWSLPRPEGER